MIRQIGFELYKMSRRPRTYLGFAAFALINFFVMIGLKYGDLESLGVYGATRSGFEVAGSPVNAGKPVKATIRFSNYKVNKGISDKVFEPKPPAKDNDPHPRRRYRK